MQLVRVGQIKLDFPTLQKHRKLLFIDQITGNEVKFKNTDAIIIDVKGFVCIEAPGDLIQNGEIAYD